MALGYTPSQHRKNAAAYGREMKTWGKKVRASAAAGRCATARKQLVQFAAWYGATKAEQSGAGTFKRGTPKAVQAVTKAYSAHCKCVKKAKKK